MRMILIIGSLLLFSTIAQAEDCRGGQTGTTFVDGNTVTEDGTICGNATEMQETVADPETDSVGLQIELDAQAAALAAES